jgi:hypothetical protein
VSGGVLTQFDDDVQEFMMAYAKGPNNKMKAKYYSYEGSALLLFWQFFIIVLFLWSIFCKGVE